MCVQAVHHQGVVYLTTNEHYGVGRSGERLPSIYWSIVEPELPAFCDMINRDWGIIASSEGLATAYPVIAARKTALSGAVLAYSYGGAGTIAGGLFHAYAGARTMHRQRLVLSGGHNGISMVPPSQLRNTGGPCSQTGALSTRSYYSDRGIRRGVQLWQVQEEKLSLALLD